MTNASQKSNKTVKMVPFYSVFSEITLKRFHPGQSLRGSPLPPSLAPLLYSMSTSVVPITLSPFYRVYKREACKSVACASLPLTKTYFWLFSYKEKECRPLALAFIS